MPDPLIYGQAFGAAVLASAVAVLVLGFATRPITAALRPGSIAALAAGLGLVAGYAMLALRVQWPPVNALDRLLTILLPLAIVIEILAGVKRTPVWLAWILRVCLAAAAPRILLHGSIYLTGADDDWPPLAVAVLLAATAALFAAAWGGLGRLEARSPGLGPPLALAMAILCAGLTMMMSGYLQGGAAALPLSAAVLATSLTACLLSRCTPSSTPWDTTAEIGVGMVGLFGLLFIGRFFGELTTTTALVILLSPLLCWTTRLPRLRDQQPWLQLTIQLVLVAIPLILILVQAKLVFDREMAPLLTASPFARLRWLVLYAGW
ncbi:hypothetical protein [Lignipirellula cremea]|uniref:Uncharacterized protein n=1 Tax=Lignipirellula cremea TaxID=2528010 RepID=A0A518DKY8_9BACT|nr:hypothetical protein [Lignipirellula cremea]QDU92494.1 hypothetical protein Pla8534_02420 [Lignipirellula cremea]